MTRIDEHRNQHTYPRQFLPTDIDLGNWDQIKAAIDRLGNMPHTTMAEMEQWLLAYSELQAAVAEEYTARHIKMTCATDDPELEKQYLFYLENIAPKTETAYMELNRRFMEAAPERHLDADRYTVYLRAVKAEDVRRLIADILSRPPVLVAVGPQAPWK